jgi:hypothetical protein
MQDPNRLKLFDVYSKLIRLRIQNPAVFNSTAFTYDFYDNNGNFKRFQIADPNPNGMKVTVVANFDVVPQTRTITFQSTGTWYSFLSNGSGTGLNGSTGTTVNILSTDQVITLQPGEYHVYIDRQVVLPLKLLSFNGRRTTNNISLGWLTTNEDNVKHFIVERSFDGVAFNNIATVITKRSSDAQLTYTYVDRDPASVKSNKKIYYRLKLIDKDGSYSYSTVTVINASSSSTAFTLYPNPVRGSQVYLSLEEVVSNRIHFKIEDSAGKLYKSYTQPLNDNKTIPVDIKNLSSGVYILTAETGGKTFVKQFLIQH